MTLRMTRYEKRKREPGENAGRILNHGSAAWKGKEWIPNMKFGRKRPAPVELEWEKVCRKEERWIEKRMTRKEPLLEKRLENLVPASLKETLDGAFCKAFRLIFDKGGGVVEKTLQKEKRQQDFLINQYANEIRQSRRSLRAFSKKAASSGRKNLFISGASGVGMGVLGIGIPDVPVFIGMALKAIYETALDYGFTYESEEERYFILLLISGAMSHGTDLLELSRRADEYMESVSLPEHYSRSEQIRQTAAVLSEELLLMKFIQGIPLVGATGGVFDAVWMKQITEYAELKYRKRFLMTVFKE